MCQQIWKEYKSLLNQAKITSGIINRTLNFVSVIHILRIIDVLYENLYGVKKKMINKSHTKSSKINPYSLEVHRYITDN